MAAAVRVAAINKAVHANDHPKSKHPKPHKPEPRYFDGPYEGVWKYQPLVMQIYTNQYVEYFVAFLIIANFFISIAEKSIDPMAGHMNPSNRLYHETWEVIGLMFNFLFLIELMANMYAYWCWDFWLVAPKGAYNGWNIFDFVIVFVGWMFQLGVPLPGPMKLLRLMRAFRVFRLFKRIKSLQKIIVSLGRAVPGMINAMVIMLIVMSIYAMLGVEFFSKSFTPREYQDISHPSGGRGYTDDDWILTEGGENYVEDPEKYVCPSALLEGNATTCYETSRGNGWGEEYFGNFGRSLYTLFQVLTGDSWSEAIARPMFEAEPIVTSLYFVSYVVFIAIVLVNVVVAVLLEKMVDDGSDEEDEEEHYHHKSHEWVHPDAKATIGEMWDLKQDIRAKHTIMQAQLDALTANMEALCAKQGLTPVRGADLMVVNDVAKHDDTGFFDEKGNRLTKKDPETGKAFEVVKSWVYTQEDKELEMEEEKENGGLPRMPSGSNMLAQTKSSAVAPAAPDADVKVVEMEES